MKRTSQKQKEKKQKENLVRGSIRCDDNLIFHTSGKKDHIHLRFGKLKGQVNPPISKETEALFDAANVNHTRLPDDVPGLIQELSDSKGKIEIEGIEWDDVNHIRIKFAGLTQYQFNARKERIQEFLDSNGIDHKEKDGKDVCMFGCLSNQQYELIAPHWWE